MNCQKTNKILIFDNASSPMSLYKNSNICNFGNSSFGSLHHTKFLGFGEGGFIVIPCEEYDEINRILNFGFTSQRIYNSLSSNFKMSDVTAAYCLAHAESYDVERHLEIQNLLFAEMKKIGVSVFNTDNKMCSYALGNLPLLFNDKIDTQRFRDLGVEANKYYRPLKSLKHSNHLFSRIVNLPLHAGLTDYQIEFMCKVVCESKKSV
jgi:dTDP-4-amino-4,6-dideoxygalactose transaminase